MVTMILILYILLELDAPPWTFILLGIGAFVRVLCWGIDLQKHASE